MKRRCWVWLVAAALSACSEPSASAPVPTGAAVPSDDSRAVTPTTARPAPSSTTAPVASGPMATAVSAPSTTAAPLSTTSSSTTTTPPTTTPPTTTPPATAPPATTPYRVPVEPATAAGWGNTHAGYPATDIFLACGASVVSPVNGTLLEVRRENRYDPDVDNPATRGGRSVSILGDDGVRYYLAHFERIEDGLDVGVRVTSGQRLGDMGMTGRASACHAHFAISPPCPGKEWSVRRGVIWPYPYLDAWLRGEQLAPGGEVSLWSAENPDACAAAMADPNAPDS